MKNLVPIFLISIFILSCTEKTQDSQMPKPTEVKWDMEDGGKSVVREAWLEMIHRSAPGIDWKVENELERSKLAKMRSELRNSNNSRDTEVFAEGDLEGEWEERGSLNQAGNLVTVTYESIREIDYLYGISAGGTVWRGELFESNWVALNDDIRFSNSVIEVLNVADNDRILAARGKNLFYSDDQGENWILAEGFDFYDGWGRPIAMREINNEIYYLVLTWDEQDWESQQWLYRSVDGITFEKIKAFRHDVNAWEARRYTSMWSTLDETQLYIMHLRGELYRVEGNEVLLIHEGEDLPNPISDFEAIKNDTVLSMYALDNAQNIYHSVDTGKTWDLKGQTPVNAWDVGLGVSGSEPNTLYMGAVNSFKSTDGGTNWEVINEWWQYYGNMNFLHADIMDMRTFHHDYNFNFTLIANHGGLHVSYDDMSSTENVGSSGLNIAQYYDVVTDPTDPNYIYAGTQDQGHQRTSLAGEEGSVYFDQVFSGDYGHYAFSREGQSLWILYPFGSVQYYHSPKNSGVQSFFDILGQNRPVSNWIYPTEETPDPSDNSIFIAGGNMTDGPGSFLITLSALTSPPYTISATQFDYDFRSNSNSGEATISSIEASLIDENRLYVSTNDGSFFYSGDYGISWTKSVAFSGPGQHWLYGADIYASKKTSDLVWFGGSGYSNPAVFVSTDGGVNFEAMADGLPNSLVHELAPNEDETLLFAATDVGPYICVLAERKWYPMMGVDAPLQEYYSVEYVASEKLVRYGTHGRGIWDFNISYQPVIVSIEDQEIKNELLIAYPNPTDSWVSIELPKEPILYYELIDMAGKVLYRSEDNITYESEKLKINLETYSSGNYIIRLQSKGTNYTVNVIKN